MTGRAAVVELLLFAGVAVELLCCIGVLVMRGALQKLHFLAPAGTVGAWLIAAAVAVSHHPFSGAGLKAMSIALLLTAFGPVASHATARAQYAREGGIPRGEAP